MRRAQRLLFGLSAAALLAGGAIDAAAQTPSPGQAQGLRYLSWNGRPAAVATPAPAPEAIQTADARRDLRRPNRVIPHGGFSSADARPGLTPAPGGNRNALTPANSWMRSPPPAEAAPAPSQPPAPAPAVAPAPAPAPVPRPLVARPAPVAPAPAPAPAPRPVEEATYSHPTPASILPDYVPGANGRQGAPAAIVSGDPSAVPLQPQVPADAAPVDPMAPRRDAPIFRMQQSAPPAPAEVVQRPASESREPAEERPAAPRQVAYVQTNPADHPAPQGARYYSVHRQNGQAPDAVSLPQPTYVDALTITNIPETPTTQDLAQPADPPAMIRDAQGRIRIQPAPPEGDYQ